MMAWSSDYRFPSQVECQAVKEHADSLPNLVIVPFEDGVSDSSRLNSSLDGAASSASCLG